MNLICPNCNCYIVSKRAYKKYCSGKQIGSSLECAYCELDTIEGKNGKILIHERCCPNLKGNKNV